MKRTGGGTVALVVVLFAVSVCASATLAIVYALTKDSIAEQQQQARNAGLLVAVPAADPRGFEQVTVPAAAEGTESFEYFRAYDRPVEAQDKRLVGYAVEGRASGYSSTIRVIVGVDPSLDTILGMKVLFQKETPGLGTRCEEVEVEGTLWTALFGEAAQTSTPKEPWFQKQFRQKPERLGGGPQHVSDFVKDGRSYRNIDTITGATITTNAVVQATLGAIEQLRKATGSQ